MKLFNIVILSTYIATAFAVFDGSGPLVDKKFLGGAIVGQPACPTGKFNLLEKDGVTNEPKGYDDNTKAISNCQTCAKATFNTPYSAPASGFTLAMLNRKECCFNEELESCREQMRAYQEGCNAGGVEGNNRPLKDDGTTAGTCT